MVEKDRQPARSDKVRCIFYSALANSGCTPGTNMNSLTASPLFSSATPKCIPREKMRLWNVLHVFGPIEGERSRGRLILMRHQTKTTTISHSEQHIHRVPSQAIDHQLGKGLVLTIIRSNKRKESLLTEREREPNRQRPT